MRTTWSLNTLKSGGRRLKKRMKIAEDRVAKAATNEVEASKAACVAREAALEAREVAMQCREAAKEAGEAAKEARVALERQRSSPQAPAWAPAGEAKTKKLARSKEGELRCSGKKLKQHEGIGNGLPIVLKNEPIAEV